MPRMPDPLLIEALGHRFEVDLSAIPADEAAALRQQWARCAPDPQDPAPVAESPAVPLSQLGDPVRRDYALSSSITFAAIRQAAGTGLMLHACGIADDSGQVAVLVAASGTGKTTAAARLCARDFGYVSDETVLIRPDLTVLPYPKPLSVVLEADDPHHKQQHGPDELQLRVPPHALQAGLLVLLDRIDRETRDDDAPQPTTVPTLEPVGLIDAMMTLIPHTSSLTALDRPLTALARIITEMGGAQTLYYREIGETGDLLARELQQDRRPTTDFVSITAPSDAAPPDISSDSDSEPDQHAGPEDERLVGRAPFDDAIVADDEVLLLAGSRPLRLSALGATIWLAATEQLPVLDLVDVCQATHGEHPQAAVLVRHAIDELVGAGALILGRAADRVSA